MLRMNGLAGIQPLQNQAETRALQRTRKPFRMEWGIDMSMAWSTDSLKQAAKFNPLYDRITETTLNGCIDSFLSRLTQEERNNVDPLQIEAMLETSLAPPAVEEPIDLLPSPRTPKMSLWIRFRK
jgi:hypothetical protein